MYLISFSLFPRDRNARGQFLKTFTETALYDGIRTYNRGVIHKLILNLDHEISSDRLKFHKQGCLTYLLNRNYPGALKKPFQLKDFSVKKFSRSEIEVSKNFLRLVLSKVLKTDVVLATEVEKSSGSNVEMVGSNLVHSLSQDSHRLNSYLAGIDRDFQSLGKESQFLTGISKQASWDFLSKEAVTGTKPHNTT